MKKYTAEFIGTFFLVLAIGMAVVEPGAGILAPIVIGATLMVMVYAGGHVSGAHFNPAVTFGVWLRGRCPTADVPGYLIAHIVGAVVAAKIALYFKGNPTLTASEIKVVPALIAEFLGAFALVYVVLNVATAKSTAGNSYYGLAIGFTVTAMASAFGGISRGVFNPAVAVGLSIMGHALWSNVLGYFVTSFAAAFLAAEVFRRLNPDDK
jgi:aquaporin Z